MGEDQVDDSLLLAWLTARSIARGLPAPVADHGGFRVDTKSEAEVRRWLFSRAGTGLAALARSIDAPRHPIKLCGDGDTLLAALPEGWQLHAQNWFMRSSGTPVALPDLGDYRIETTSGEAVTEVRIMAASGDLAASGYAAETDDAFVYDRIVTMPEHRRKGLGTMLMAVLGHAKRCPETPELLVATDDGRALYTRLGWQTLSSYSTASIPGRLDQ
ncbi:GNAT family N-acetyltransferase [Sphingomonas sp. CGMCC 1.13654]|uniref:GNAT family N-acetyltransferase n=1 Tax=Sphingomonas chungangi TaxID=2683589 RepID=A0A838L4T4_9SPHN|nr:GNAT family N-acetyltransferase [Sphingomonas chungangi]MBA2934174.1 GNAT family N-acetyltransferase [Sphingomonas chungangi]MVW57215.1 GNAT family N-acetyltransferase [Sphingomonas chungangi]